MAPAQLGPLLLTGSFTEPCCGEEDAPEPMPAGTAIFPSLGHALPACLTLGRIEAWLRFTVLAIVLGKETASDAYSPVTGVHLTV